MSNRLELISRIMFLSLENQCIAQKWHKTWWQDLIKNEFRKAGHLKKIYSKFSVKSESFIDTTIIIWSLSNFGYCYNFLKHVMFSSSLDFTSEFRGYKHTHPFMFSHTLFTMSEQTCKGCTLDKICTLYTVPQTWGQLYDLFSVSSLVRIQDRGFK